MGCEQDTPYCDSCHSRYFEEVANGLDPEDFEPCDECKEMLKTYCWVCNGDVGYKVEDGCCKSCS